MCELLGMRANGRKGDEAAAQTLLDGNLAVIRAVPQQFTLRLFLGNARSAIAQPA